MLRLTAAAAAMQVPDFLPAAAPPAADGFFAQKPTAVERARDGPSCCCWQHSGPRKDVLRRHSCSLTRPIDTATLKRL